MAIHKETQDATCFLQPFVSWKINGKRKYKFSNVAFLKPIMDAKFLMYVGF